MAKRILLLGGSHYLLPVIEAARANNVQTITMDYLPDNVAHRYSDEYVNVSITDKDAVLDAAEQLNIDGVMSFACDPGVVSAAYVAEKMGLPFQGSYEAVCTLQDKGAFRDFLRDNGFSTPWAKRYTHVQDALNESDGFPWPVIVKPVDSAGSKGVTRLDDQKGLRLAAEHASSYSQEGAFIIERFLTFKGFHSSTDSFTVAGDLRFCTFSDHLFDKEAENPYTPSGIIWPSTMERVHQSELTGEIQRLMRLLDMHTGIYNIETCVDIDNVPYMMEISPRGGGNKIAELQRLAYGVDLIDAEVKKAVGIPIDSISQTECDGFWCDMVVHARPGQNGVLQQVEIDPLIRTNYLAVEDIAVKPGDKVKPYTGANTALGNLFLRFDSREELDDVVAHASEWLRLRLV